MEPFKITAKIPRPVEEVFEYITTPSNFPRWFNRLSMKISGIKYLLLVTKQLRFFLLEQ